MSSSYNIYDVTLTLNEQNDEQILIFKVEKSGLEEWFKSIESAKVIRTFNEFKDKAIKVANSDFTETSSKAASEKKKIKKKNKDIDDFFSIF